MIIVADFTVCSTQRITRNSFCCMNRMLIFLWLLRFLPMAQKWVNEWMSWNWSEVILFNKISRFNRLFCSHTYSSFSLPFFGIWCLFANNGLWLWHFVDFWRFEFFHPRSFRSSFNIKMRSFTVSWARYFCLSDDQCRFLLPSCS